MKLPSVALGLFFPINTTHGNPCPPCLTLGHVWGVLKLMMRKAITEDSCANASWNQCDHNQ